MEGHGGLYSATKPRQIGSTRGYSRWLHLLQMPLVFAGGRAGRAQGRGTSTGPEHAPHGGKYLVSRITVNPPAPPLEIKKA